MVKVHRGLFIVLLMHLLIACTSGPTFTAENNDYRVELEFAQPPKLNQSVATTLRFYVQDVPLSVENVVCDLQMPGMVMGSMRPIADRQPDGSHLVNLLFTMDGEWSIIVTADSADGPIRLYVEGIIIDPNLQVTITPD